MCSGERELAKGYIENKPVEFNEEFSVEIRDVRAIEVALPIQGRNRPYGINLVEVTTDEGTIGIGESRGQGIPAGVISALVDSNLKPLLVGCSPFDVEALYEKMYRSNQNVGQRGIMIMAISGVELALWDIIGKIARLPVYNLVGGRVHRDIKAYASLGGYRTPAEAVKGAKHYVDMGFRAIKFHQREIESTKMLRRELGDEIEIMLDVSGLWTPDEAIRKARELADSNVSWLESAIYPQDDVQGFARLTAAVGETVPICAGENEYTVWGFKDIIEKKAVNILNHDTIKCGGLWQAKKIAAMAEVQRILCAPHSACSPVGLETALHLTTSTNNCAYAEVIHSTLYALEGLSESILERPLELNKGFVRARDGPGFGIELDGKVIEKFKIGK